VANDTDGPGAPVVTDNPERERFELRVDGAIVGVADYHRDADVITFTHTEVDPELRGQGLAAVLIDAALDASAAAGLAVVPVCPYVRDVVERRNTQQPSSVDDGS
jgi:predicted GNAT family acetyltransferase